MLHRGHGAEPSFPNPITRVYSTLLLPLLPLHHSQVHQCGLAALHICDERGSKPGQPHSSASPWDSVAWPGQAGEAAFLDRMLVGGETVDLFSIHISDSDIRDQRAWLVFKIPSKLWAENSCLETLSSNWKKQYLQYKTLQTPMRWSEVRHCSASADLDFAAQRVAFQEGAVYHSLRSFELSRVFESKLFPCLIYTPKLQNYSRAQTCGLENVSSRERKFSTWGIVAAWFLPSLDGFVSGHDFSPSFLFSGPNVQVGVKPASKKKSKQRAK